MKLLLTSQGITNKSLQDKFIEIVGKDPSEMSVAYIPTAINTSSNPNKRWVIDSLRKLDDMKIANIDIVDISAISKDIWLPGIERADVIYVEGGDPMYLKEQFMNTDLINLLSTSNSEKVYVGCSAGSNILGEIIIKSTKDEIGYKTEKGLGILNFSIRPHFLRGDRGQFSEEFIQELAEKLNTTIYAIDDNSAIAIEDGNIEIVTEGKWKKFN